MTKVTQAHIDARVGAIRDAARRVIARRGVEAATMNEVAAEAGLSTGAIYRYFSGKDDLIVAAFAEGRERTRRAFEQARATTGSMLEAMAEAGRLSLADVLDRDTICLDLECALGSARHGGIVSEQTKEFRRWVIDLVEGFAAHAQQNGEIAPDVDPRELAVLLTAFVMGLALINLELGEGEISAEDSLKLLLRFISQPLRPTP